MIDLYCATYDNLVNRFARQPRTVLLNSPLDLISVFDTPTFLVYWKYLLSLALNTPYFSNDPALLVLAQVLPEVAQYIAHNYANVVQKFCI